MEYEEARAIGDAAESRVAAALAALQGQYGFVVLHDLLIGKKTQGGLVTGQLDHVVVDPYGVWIVETKTRTRALLRGTYADAKWTACYPGGNKKSLQNPLRQNEQHQNLLHQLLKDSGHALPPDRIRGLTVFVDTNLTQLELDSISMQRVSDIDQLAERFATRYDFVIQSPMSAEETAALVRIVSGLDRSADESFQRAHASYRKEDDSSARGATAAGKAANTARRFTPRAPTAAAPDQSPSTSGGPRAAVLWAAALVGVVLLVWIAFGMFTGTAPWWVWIGAVIALSAMTHERSSSVKRRKKAHKQAPAQVPFGRWFAEKLVLLGLLAVVGIAIVAGVPWALKKSIGNLTTVSSVVSPSVPPVPAAPTADVALAKKQLKQADPVLYKKVTSPDQPRMSSAGNTVTYEWDYLDKKGSSAVRVRQISITLDASGQIIGASE